MKRARNLVVFVLTFMLLVSSINVVIFAAKGFLQIKLVSNVKYSYEVFEQIPLIVKTNYPGNVQYRAYIVDEVSKKTYEIFTNTFTNKMSGTKEFKFNAKIAKPGKYHITVMVKRANSKVKYDSLVKTKTFNVKDVKFSLKSISAKFNGNQVVNATLKGNTFTFDLTNMDDADSLTHIILTANKNAVVDIAGNKFQLSGNVERMITPTMLGADENPPEGVTLATMREKADNTGYLKGTISLVSGKEKTTYNIHVKVK